MTQCMHVSSLFQKGLCVHGHHPPVGNNYGSLGLHSEVERAEKVNEASDGSVW